MYKQYFKQALQMLRESPFFGVITVLGTALAICMIMVMVIVFEIRNKGFKPELNRDRTLYVKDVAITRKNEEGSMNYSLVSGRVAKECFFTLKTPEAVSMQLSRAQTLVTSTDQARRMKCDLLRTDEGFWRIFDFEFLAGKPFLRSDVESNIKKAVICRRLALRIFGQADESVIGQTIWVARRPYVVGGIVEDVPALANGAYAHIWIPYPQADVDRLINEETLEGLIGSYRVLILARSSGDFDTIKAEVEQNVARFNNSLQTLKIDLMKQPDTQMESRLRVWSNVVPDVPKMLGQYAMVLIVLLLVPAMNLSGLTASRMQKRMGELGVRKAFGAN
ncbi:ABC transporter permease, partial [Parabacteroides sp.]